jgi:UDP-N-acetylglucosamine:LPS N-acetylglucosamine transferase
VATYFQLLPLLIILKKRNYDIFWLGGVHGLERKLVKIDPVRMLLIRFSGVRKNGVLRWLFLPFTLITACFDALAILNKGKAGCSNWFWGVCHRAWWNCSCVISLPDCHS